VGFKCNHGTSTLQDVNESLPPNRRCYSGLSLRRLITKKTCNQHTFSIRVPIHATAASASETDSSHHTAGLWYNPQLRGPTHEWQPADNQSMGQGKHGSDSLSFKRYITLPSLIVGSLALNWSDAQTAGTSTVLRKRNRR